MEQSATHANELARANEDLKEKSPQQILQWAVARFAVYGLLFGWVAARRQTILPCVLAHVALDVYAGVSG